MRRFNSYPHLISAFIKDSDSVAIWFLNKVKYPEILKIFVNLFILEYFSILTLMIKQISCFITT